MDDLLTEPKRISFTLMLILAHRNEPNVHKEELQPNPEGWHGAQLSVTIEGNWSTYRAKIIKCEPGPHFSAGYFYTLALNEFIHMCGRYLRQIAVITPYTEFSFFYKGEEEKNNMRLVFRWRCGEREGGM